MTAILNPRSTRADEKARELSLPVPVKDVPVLAAAPVLDAAPVAEPPRRRVRPVLSIRGLRIFGVVMLTLYTLGAAVQPSPDGPDPVAPWWDTLLVNAIFFGLVALVVGAVVGRRWPLPVGVGVGATLVFGTLTCPLQGHHQIGAWWFIQLVTYVAMTVLPAVLLRRTQKSG